MRKKKLAIIIFLLLNFIFICIISCEPQEKKDIKKAISDYNEEKKDIKKAIRDYHDFEYEITCKVSYILLTQINSNEVLTPRMKEYVMSSIYKDVRDKTGQELFEKVFLNTRQLLNSGPSPEFGKLWGLTTDMLVLDICKRYDFSECKEIPNSDTIDLGKYFACFNDLAEKGKTFWSNIESSTVKVDSTLSQEDEQRFVDEIEIKDSIGFHDVVVGQSNFRDIVNMFGSKYELINHNNYSIEIKYKKRGCSFLYRYNDPHKVISIISLYHPFKGITRRGIILGQSSARNVIEKYGHVNWSTNLIDTWYLPYPGITFYVEWDNTRANDPRFESRYLNKIIIRIDID